MIQPTINKNTQRVINSDEFVTMKISNISIETVKILLSEIQTYDVVNLYPSVPIDEAIIVIVYILNTDISDFQA